MASPFSLFRKHEKELMVIMTGIAMFCFVILDSVTPGKGSGDGSNPLVVPLILAAVGAGIAWIHGQITKKSSTYWLNGLVIGACCGTAMVLFSLRGQPGVSTSLGKFKPHEFSEMKVRRQQANQIMDHLVFLREIPDSQSQFKDQLLRMFIQRYRFGGATTREVFMNYLLIKEADRLGIQLSDAYVQNYLVEVSDKKLDRTRFEKLRREFQISEGQIFDIIRQELRARIAYQVLNPEVVYMPEQYWQDFQKFNVKHSVDATAIPVEPFSKLVEAPQDGQLTAFFTEFKSKFPSGDQPGFRQQERKRAAYLTADVELLEKEVGEPTEDALKAIYEARKDSLFKDATLPEGSTSKAKGDDLTPDASKTEPPPAAEDKKADPKPPEEAKPVEKQPEEKKPETKKEDDAQCGAEDPPVKAEAPKADAPKADAPKTDAPKTDAPKTEEPAKTDEADSVKTSDATKAAPAKYKAFDEVKDQLRDLWLRDQVQALAKTRLEEATTFINLRRTERTPIEPSDKEEILKERQLKADAEFAATLAGQVKEFVKKKGLVYAETKLLTFSDFMEDKDNPLSSAREPFDISSITDFRNIPTPKRVPERVFSGASLSFIPENAEGGGGDQQYVFWIIEVVEEHDPKIDEPGIREQVVKAWRLKEARPRAEKRATDFAEAVGKTIKEKHMAEALGDQTVTGDKDSVQLSVISSSPFTWLRQSFAGFQSNPLGGRQMEFGTIPGIDNIDHDFMQAISQMAVGDVKVLPNADKTVFYVVHVKSRTPGGPQDAAYATQQKQFIDEHPQMSGTYDQLARPTFTVVQGRWFEEFMKKYSVDLATLDEF